MPKFRKKPVVIEAMQLTTDTFWKVYDWIDKEGPGVKQWDWCEPLDLYGERYIDIRTLEGVIRASENDWVIKGVAGEMYPCKPDIFEQTYDAAASSPSIEREVSGEARAAGVPVVAPLPRVSDEQVLEWAKRHDLPRWDSITDARAAFEDAQTLHLTDGVEGRKP